MIEIKLNRPDFEYDIYSLAKAFYPKQDVVVTAEGQSGEKEADFQLRVDYLEQTIRIARADEKDAKDGCETPRGPGAVEFPVDFSDRVDTKNQLKRNLYQILSQETKKELPWGTLTGIRPTKIAMKFLEEGKGSAAAAEYMRDTYLTSPQKAELAAEIAEREFKLLSKLDYEKGYSLYIGIPFCPTTCLYCSFTSYPLAMWESRVDAYLNALEKEIEFAAAECAGRYLNTVYIGGGTPTTLSPAQSDRLLGIIEQRFDLSHCLEFTVEAGRPDSITRDKLLVLKDHGISRISINPQTMKQETLRLIGRHHTVEQTVACFEMARELGFDNINMDFIMGLPGETIDDVQNTMEQVQVLRPDNITVHSLALKRAARLNLFREDYEGYGMVNTQEHMELAAAYAEKMGLAPYYLYRQKGMAGNLENVGYAKPEKAGIYNILMMEEKQDIVALGAGSISKRVVSERQIRRCENVKDVSQYIGRIGEMMERKRVLFHD